MRISTDLRRAASWYTGAAYHVGYEGNEALTLGALYALWSASSFASSGLRAFGGMRFSFGLDLATSARRTITADDWLRVWKHDGHARLVRIASEQFECRDVAEVEETDLARRLWLTVGEST